jgi:hypothetical protein
LRCALFYLQPKTTIITRESGDPVFESVGIEPRGRSVLDTPLPRSMTTAVEANIKYYVASSFFIAALIDAAASS